MFKTLPRENELFYKRHIRRFAEFADHQPCGAVTIKLIKTVPRHDKCKK